LGAACTVGLGACEASGVTICTLDGLGTECNATPGPPLGPNDPTCDGIDDDCDGLTDEDYASVPTSCGVGYCAATGATSCVGGAVQDSCLPGDPLSADDATCDGVDDNCSGLADEDYASVPTSCGVGYCAAAGATSCVGGAVQDSCLPGDPLSADDATCDGVDDNCSGLADEDYLPTPTTCGVGQCAGNTGQLTCVAGSTVDTCNPLEGATPELCDALDNDCDDAIDNGFDVGVACTNGIGACERAGTKVCTGDGLGTECDAVPGTPTTEICNGIDDDCDTFVDNAAVPTGVARVSVSRGITVTFIEWLPIADATGYDLVRGLALSLSSSGGDFTSSTQECLANDQAGTAYVEMDTPVTGEAFWYLVRPMNCGGSGTYDEPAGGQAGSRDAEIAASPNACP